MKNMEDLIKIEPLLKDIIKYVQTKNIIAENEDIYWYNVWHTVKLKIRRLVDNDDIMYDTKNYNILHDYLYTLGFNMK